MMELSFPVQEKDFSKIEVKNNICIKVFGYKDEFFQFLFQIKNLKTQWVGLLLLIDDDKSHYVQIKDFDTFMFHNTKNKKKWFCKSHLIFCELDKFDVKISVIPNALEKYMAFFKIKTQSSLTVCNL